MARKRLKASSREAAKFLQENDLGLAEAVGHAYGSVSGILWSGSRYPDLDDCTDQELEELGSATQDLQVETWLIAAAIGIRAKTFSKHVEFAAQATVEDLDAVEKVGELGPWTSEAFVRLVDVTCLYADFVVADADDGDAMQLTLEDALGSILRLGAWATAREVFLQLYLMYRTAPDG